MLFAFGINTCMLQDAELRIFNLTGLIYRCFFCCFKEYVETVKADMAAYEEEARHLAKLGDMHKAQIILTKKKHAEREVRVLSSIFRQAHCVRPKKKKFVFRVSLTKKK